MALQDILSGRPIPVFLLTGFLGSGKTTLLHRLLASGAVTDTAIVVNEFSDLGIDQLTIRQVSEHLVLLNSGCVCCTIREDLLQALRKLFIDRLSGGVGAFERVLIETSGIGDPVPIVHTLLTDPFLRERFCLGGTITTIDALQPLTALCRHAEGLRQAAVADLFVITKTDLASQETTEALCGELAAMNPNADIVDTAKIEALAALLKSATTDADQAGSLPSWLAQIARAPAREAPPGGLFAQPRRIGAHTARVQSFVLGMSDPVAWDDFIKWIQLLLAKTPEGILRIKGFVDIVGESLPVLVQCVRHVFYPATSLPEWPGGKRSSRLVLILENAAQISPAELLASTLPTHSGVNWTVQNQRKSS